jgi:hypothetical protein
LPGINESLFSHKEHKGHKEKNSFALFVSFVAIPRPLVLAPLRFFVRRVAANGWNGVLPGVLGYTFRKKNFATKSTKDTKRRIPLCPLCPLWLKIFFPFVLNYFVFL